MVVNYEAHRIIIACIVSQMCWVRKAGHSRILHCCCCPRTAKGQQGDMHDSCDVRSMACCTHVRTISIFSMFHISILQLAAVVPMLVINPTMTSPEVLHKDSSCLWSYSCTGMYMCYCYYWYCLYLVLFIPGTYSSVPVVQQSWSSVPIHCHHEIRKK